MKNKHKEEIIAKLVKCEDVKNPEKHFEQLRLMGNKLMQNSKSEDLIITLNALANKKRVQILKILREKDRCVCELEAILDESQPSISHHLKILEKVGLVKGWKKGKFTHYDFVKEKYEFWMELIKQEIV
ncbi:hypothetical protein LCGC14_0721380 [marine sediment metagenome]|uniref:HTH arsR-type domain-containing protein n=1 Tax=marine sediment metagenome TaxID=412755 RepID=A0A0F9TJL4_9ZZZZ|nr:ArsR family transcriptional regulator [archaeon]